MSETAPRTPHTSHILIPFAAASSEDCQRQLSKLELPNLRQLLHKLTLIEADTGADDTFSPPHERAWAKALGLVTADSLVDGYIPWAAQAAAELGLDNASSAPWGWVSLCNYFVGTGSMTLEDPAQLQVTEAESRQLLTDMRPYFVEDGITLHYVAPTQWLASGEPLQSIPTASLDRVVGRNLDAWQPEGQAAAKLRRLQNEMQMLLYINTVNDARNHAKTTAINSIWLHGTGELTAIQPKVSTNINVPRNLADAALREDWAAWAQAWEQLDATLCADLLKRVQAGEPVTLTLCGEHSALTYELRPKSGFERLKSNFRGILGLQPVYSLPNVL